MNDQTIVANNIKESYCKKPISKLDELKALDKKVKRPAKVFAYIFGVLGALVLGVGMCLAMKVIGNIMALGIVIGVVGIIMVSINYAIYKQMLKKRRTKYCKQVLQLTEEITAG